jgi:phosphodiesterase/alkaline phosphatase D-like protein
VRKIALLATVVILAALLAGCAGGGKGDQTPPVISGVSASSITETSAVITWTTNEPATSQVEYGPTTSYGSTSPLNSTLVTSHSVSLPGLTAGTTYHYRVKSKDTAENEKTSGDYTFTTTSAGDTTAPVISGVSASGITISTATITWTTDEPATSQVEYGPTTSYGSTTPLDSTLVTSHSISLLGLTAGTTYHYRVKSKDAADNVATSGDHTLTTRSLLIAFIYSTDAASASSYESLMEDNGYSVTLIPMSAVATTDFSVYGLIIVGPDTGSGYHWGDAASVAAIEDSEKPIIGLYSGGASLFQELGLSINWGHGGYDPEQTGIYVIDPSHTIFNSPNSIVVPENRIVELYSSPCSVQVEYAPSVSPDVTPLGRYVAETGYYALVQEEQYMLWSFAASPESMTQAGKDLFLNVVDFMLTTAFPPDTTAPVISQVSASNITTSTATITWTTDVGATSQVEYGLTTSYGSTTTLDDDLVYGHSVSLTGLTAGTTYHYRVKSKDASENEAVSGDYTFTTESLPIAHIYSTDDTGANSYKSLLEDNGYSVTLIAMSDVATTDFSTYDLIIVDSDTGSWDDPASVSAVDGSANPIIGLGEGGYDFFGQLGLNTGRPHGWHGSNNSIYIVDTSHPIFNMPNSITIPEDTIIQLYTTTNHVGIDLPSIPENVVVLGREADEVEHYPLTLENDRYLFWGFTASPESMTQVGKDLFLNVVDFLM